MEELRTLVPGLERGYLRGCIIEPGLNPKPETLNTRHWTVDNEH